MTEPDPRKVAIEIAELALERGIDVNIACIGKLAKRGSKALAEDAHESTTKRPKRHMLLTALNRVALFLLIFSASYWVFLVPRLAYEFARRGMDGVWSYLAHIAFMATLSYNRHPSTWPDSTVGPNSHVLLAH